MLNTIEGIVPGTFVVDFELFKRSHQMVMDTSTGELLLVRHLGSRCFYDLSVRTKGFSVFKLDRSNLKWCEIFDIGDRFLFWDFTKVSLVSAKGLRLAEEFKRGNCIFFCHNMQMQVIDEMLQSFIPLRPRSKPKIALSFLLTYSLQSSHPLPIALAILQWTLCSGCFPVSQTHVLLTSVWLDSISSERITMEFITAYIVVFGTGLVAAFLFPDLMKNDLFPNVLEKTRYSIKAEFDNFEGNSRRRRKQRDSKKDLLTELFETSILDLSDCDIDVDTHYKNYSVGVRKSLDAWSGSQIDLGLRPTTVPHNPSPSLEPPHSFWLSRASAATARIRASLRLPNCSPASLRLQLTFYPSSSDGLDGFASGTVGINFSKAMFG
ncbi:hypothetical protein Ahy_A02g005701 [Arachis hypogaea]|uniref:KIB1-4 beta-propeller domain-containing protein n=1 Tax=Arachis hypogaea TaxID=3818 RepID=A0A445E802_ARAHY|nr:hypothetical protein Ahy_A02g005701 [Arachis hypogaea]